MAVFLIAFSLFFISSSLLCYTSSPFFLHIFVLFSLVGIGRWMRFSDMGGGVMVLGSERGFQYSGYKPIFQCSGMGKFCRCRLEIKGRGLGSAPCHVSYEVCLVEKFFLFVVSWSGRWWTLYRWLGIRDFR